MTRRIDNIDLMIPPKTGRRRTGNGNPPLLFLLHPIHGGSTFMDFAHLIDFAGVIEDTLRRGSLAGINVGHDANVANHRQGAAAPICFPFG